MERVNTKKDNELADNVSKSLGSVEEILGSILAISRLDSANPEISLSSFALQDITKQLEIEFAPIAKSHGLDLKFVHSSKWVKSDRALLRRLLQNLISNALKFTQSGKVLVGRNSTVNKGTHFKVCLGRVNADATSQKAEIKPKKRKLGQLTGTTVLCIDNEPAILEGMSVLLEEWGCKVATAKNFDEANAYLSGDFGVPDLILADYHLDSTTGIEVYNTLMKSLSKPIPGVLITADRSEEVKLFAENAGLNILNKPVRPAALRALVSQNKRRAIAAE